MKTKIIISFIIILSLAINITVCADEATNSKANSLKSYGTTDYTYIDYGFVYKDGSEPDRVSKIKEKKDGSKTQKFKAKIYKGTAKFTKHRLRIIKYKYQIKNGKEKRVSCKIKYKNIGRVKKFKVVTYILKWKKNEATGWALNSDYKIKDNKYYECLKGNGKKFSKKAFKYRVVYDVSIQAKSHKEWLSVF